jgi:tetratricopeptide (TPR) repeat protein
MFTALATLLFTVQQADNLWQQAGRRSEPACAEISKSDAECKAGRADSAIATCRKWLADQDFDPARFEKKTSEWLAALIVRGEAQRGLAESLEAAGQYDEAVTAFIDCRTRHPIPSTCGNAYAEQEVSSALGQGRCLEKLNRHKEAVQVYFSVLKNNGLASIRVPTVRIVELYESAGKLDLLRNDLDRQDLLYIDRQALMGRKIRDLESLERELPSRPFRRLLSFATSEQNGRWEELISAIQGTWRPDDDRIEAARRLERHGSVTGPLLRADLAKGIRGRGWIAYTLGRCGGAEAVAALRKALPKDPDVMDGHLLLLGLDAAGEPGRATLRELRRLDPSLRQAIEDVYEKSANFVNESAIFPPIPKNLKLD